MSLFSKKNIKILFEKNKTKPLKSLGQNFLIDRKIVKKIIKTIKIDPDNVILEIGPGPGILTLKLAESARKVIAVEKDRKMCQILEKNLKTENIKNVKIINKDVLKIKKEIDVFSKNSDCFKVVANLPYYITSAVIRKLLEIKKPPQTIVLMIQKEVGQRICASPPNMNLLAVSVQFYAKPKIISFISKKSFWPVPKVDSALIEIKPLIKKNKEIDPALFFKVVKAGFSHPRKQLLNNLSKELKLTKEKTKHWLLENQINPEQRAETLSIDDWLKLTIFLI